MGLGRQSLNIMTFSGQELTAIIKMAKSMVMADGKIKPAEIAVMTREFMRFGILQDQVDLLLKASDSIEASQAVALIARMDEERKKYVASYLGVIMASDGDIDDNELALWTLISTLCGLPTMTVMEAINNMKNL
ncbi:hypothetical protein PG_1108 [Porphyromonas gingivalis W83]|uniref:Co-chaperone DjlA N-terminal domain-containing protein n=2 Tax=Bacteroidia TaxID=200643 RepID=Q7MVF6_PORGI|nr:hypothetical protein PG_1108 [Porphyromonas gingivalis W83]2H5N_A Chain A, Hypothetical protein PG_1108 [Porphyromonas gingivalis]2H5N_B Chain B, Hypothetical protein PG_1108 [Porphyromonas gingivalis]2H5N_C Chain C, Hypothetical protein PG_1108 [Porphyromonas gingivalis]2H5N_D Chain D, Hypothetical protein PG_1108 [Porphyromonas gingivalis]